MIENVEEVNCSNGKMDKKTYFEMGWTHTRNVGKKIDKRGSFMYHTDSYHSSYDD